MKARFFMIALFVLNIFQMSAQSNDEVTLVVSADGATKEEATKIALRSAIEQAYGTFVSANTTILNDEMVKDEIVTISNGNIKEYKEIASLVLPNGNQSVTLQATVCISKLVSYAQSKGASTEFAGATFGMNLKLFELNKQNEKKVLDNLLAQASKMIPSCFHPLLKLQEPEVDGNNCLMRFNLVFIPSKEYLALYNYVTSTLDGIEVKDRETIPKGIQLTELRISNGGLKDKDVFLLRNDYAWKRKFCLAFDRLFTTYFYGFKIVDNTGQISSLDLENQDHYKREDLNITFGNDNKKYYYGKGLFSMYNLKYDRRLAFGLFTALESLNFQFMKYKKAKELKEWELEQLIGFSTFQIICRIPLSDVSKYNKFDLKW